MVIKSKYKLRFEEGWGNGVSSHSNGVEDGEEGGVWCFVVGLISGVEGTSKRVE